MKSCGGPTKKFGPIGQTDSKSTDTQDKYSNTNYLYSNCLYSVIYKGWYDKDDLQRMRHGKDVLQRMRW